MLDHSQPLLLAAVMVTVMAINIPRAMLVFRPLGISRG